MGECKNVLVFGDIKEGHLSEVTQQLMRIGKTLSDGLKQELHVLFLGGESQGSESDEGFGYSADKVYMASDPLLKNYMTESYLAAMEQIVEKLKPTVILFSHNDIGLDLAPRLAFRLKTGVTLDCVDLKINQENGLLEQVKPVFGGKAHGHYVCTKRGPQIASVREGAFDPAEYDRDKKGEVIPLSLSLNPSNFKIRFLRKEQDASLALVLKLASANVVVSGGRGLKKKEGIDLIQETADLLNGAVAGSRPAVDYDWLPNSLQVGLTGKKVSPQVYIAVGISGALQHMAGCSKSKTIVAINSDEEAPIFKMSHFGVLGDYEEVLKGFNDEVRRIRKG